MLLRSCSTMIRQRMRTSRSESSVEMPICRACGVQIQWHKNENGKLVPYTLDGMNHFIDCPHRKEFRKRDEQQPRLPLFDDEGMSETS